MQAIVGIHLGKELRDRLSRAESLAEVGKQAAEIACMFSGGVEMVFGPVTHGGVKNSRGPRYSANIHILEATIEQVQLAGRPIFNQLLFRPYIDRHRRIWVAKHQRSPRTYYEPLLYDFYAVILDTGNVTSGHFVYGWGEGKSSSFAHEKLSKQGKRLVELPQGFHKDKIAA